MGEGAPLCPRVPGASTGKKRPASVAQSQDKWRRSPEAKKAKSATVETKLEVDEGLKTMVLMRNIPPFYDTNDVMDLLHMYEYLEHVNFVYVPLAFGTKRNFGFSFISFVEPEDALTFKTLFQGFRYWRGENAKKKGEEEGETTQENLGCTTSWSSGQNLEARIKKFSTSALMHESVPDIYKPILLERGNVIPIPVSKAGVQKKLAKTKNQNRLYKLGTQTRCAMLDAHASRLFTMHEI